jgi:acyl carrier protein
MKDKALEVISKVSGVPKETIDPDMDLVGDLGIDSPKALKLLLELEDALGVEIPDDAAAGMDTVADIMAWVERNPA